MENFTNFKSYQLKKGLKKGSKNSRLDSVSIVSRESDLDHVHGISAFSRSVWKYVAMMALLLTLGVGEMWG